jgi:hypothetical protein
MSVWISRDGLCKAESSNVPGSPWVEGTWTILPGSLAKVEEDLKWCKREVREKRFEYIKSGKRPLFQ